MEAHVQIDKEILLDQQLNRTNESQLNEEQQNCQLMNREQINRQLFNNQIEILLSDDEMMNDKTEIDNIDKIYLNEKKSKDKKNDLPFIEFCYDYKANKCNKLNCKFAHGTKNQQEYYELTGVLPPSVTFSRRYGTSKKQTEEQSDDEQEKEEKIESKEDETDYIENKDDNQLSELSINKIEMKANNKFDYKQDNKSDFESDVEKDKNNNHTDEETRFSDHILKLKRVPLNATIRDVEKFFRGYKYKKNGIYEHRIDGFSIGKK